MQRCECKVYLWWCECPLAKMWMQIFIFRYKNALNGYVMMWMPSYGCAIMQIAPLWVCHDANAFYLTQMQFNQKKKIISKLRLPRSLEPKCFQSSIHSFKKSSFFLVRLKYSVYHSCPKNMFYFDLRLLKIGNHC